MKDIKWKDAIEKVLQEEGRPLHYTEIADLIAERGYRVSLGATPNDTVSANLTTEINKLGDNSRFLKIDKGIYGLRVQSGDSQNSDSRSAVKIKVSDDKIKVISSFGIYWDKTSVHWKSNPDLLGVQRDGALEVNFKNQIGIYLLHDSRETIYVGQAIDQPLAVRLTNHTKDRLSGRWDRFSWFGIYPVSENGVLNQNVEFKNLTIKDIGDVLEAILIEAIEPRQNRKQGNQFYGIEFHQQESPEIEKRRKEQILKELTDKL